MRLKDLRVSAFAVHVNGQTAVLGDGNGRALLLNLQTREVRALPSHGRGITACAIGGPFVALASNDGCVRLFDRSSARQLDAWTDGERITDAGIIHFIYLFFVQSNNYGFFSCLQN